ncbi:MAG: hypothetical protein ABIS50_09915 [Luteolibacter sp.]|uniref:hypothetical protein n=1 Tax=Luteolibacter sp. TaxID=1962973 RepID=UPI0032641601
MKRDLLRLLAGILAATGLFSCATQNNVPPAASQFTKGADNGLRSGDQAIDRNSIDAILNNPERAAPHAEESRPGLATGWGHEKASPISGQSFVRASSKPAGTDVIYYNDSKGIKAMAASVRRVEGMQTAAGGLVEWGVKGQLGFFETYKETHKNGYPEGYNQFLKGTSYGRRLVAGESNGTYTIAIHNRSKNTLEIVASVDGLDVFDGKTASFSKRGYLVNPGTTLEIDGFRTSNDSVAAFKFSSVANSYANLRHGDTRNVGVIGIAVFTQKGVNPWTWMPEEVRQRDQALVPGRTRPGQLTMNGTRVPPSNREYLPPRNGPAGL